MITHLSVFDCCDRGISLIPCPFQVYIVILFMWSLFNDAICTSKHHIASIYVRIVNSELQTLWKEAVVAESKSPTLYRRDWRRPRKTSGRSVSGWILAGHIPNTSQNHRLSHFCSLCILLQ